MPSSTAAPVLTSATPADNSGAVYGNANIVLNFSAAMQAGSGTITISDGAMQTYMGRDGLLHTRMVGVTDSRTINISDASQVSIDGNQLTINLAADLKSGLSYSVQMGSGVLYSQSGMSYAGLQDTTKLNFSVVSAPATPSAWVDSLAMYASENPFITNIAAQHFSGTYTGQLGSGEKVQVSINGETWHDATVSGNSWSYDTTISASGTLRARVTNSAGASSEVKSQDYIYDIAGPAVASMTLDKATLSAGESAVLTVVFTEKVSGLTLADFSAHNSTVSGLESSADGLTWTATVTMGTEGLPGGDVTLNGGAVKDQAGNYGPGSASTAGYTLGAVSLAGVAIGLDDDGGKYGDDHLISDTTPTVHLDIDDVAGLLEGDRIGIYDQNSNTLLGSYTLTDGDLGLYGGDIYITLDQLSDGLRSVVARVTDAGGNIGTATGTALDFTIDSAAPTVSETSPSGEGAVDAGLQAITITFDEDIDWAASNGIIIESGGQQVLSLSFETPPPSENGPNYSYLLYNDATRVLTIHLAEALPAGASYSVLSNGVDIVDIAGNAYAGSDTLLNFRISAGGIVLPGAPTLTIVDTGAADGTTTNAIVTVTGLSASTWIYSVDGGVTYSAPLSTNGDSASFTLPHDGVYEAGKILVVQYDKVDQQSPSGQLDFDLTLDTTAPSAGISSATTFSHTDGSVTGYYAGFLASGDLIEYSVDGGAWQQASTSNNGEGGSWTAAGLAMASASSTLAVRVADSAGLVGDNYFFPSSTGPVYFGSSDDGDDFTAGDGTVLLAGAGADHVTLAGSHTGYIDGGAGQDTLELKASLNLTTTAGLFLNFEKLVLADDTTLTVGDFVNMERLNLPSSIINNYTQLTVEGNSSSHIDLTGSNAWHEVTVLNAGLLGMLALQELVTGYDIYVNTSAHMVLLVGESTIDMSHSG